MSPWVSGSGILLARMLEALRHRQEQRPGLVPASEMRQAWIESFGAENLPYSIRRGKWRVVLGPALEDGRVVRCVREGHAYYTLPQWRESEPAPRRVFSTRLKEQSEAGVRALRCAVDHLGTGALGRHIGLYWKEANGTPPPPEFVKSLRWRRALEPAIQDGTVTAMRSGPHVIFRPAERPELPDPLWPYDSDRVEEALRRINEALESAVPVELVEVELAADLRLGLDGTIRVCDVLGNLQRLRRIGATRLRPQGRQYYYVLGGHSRVRRAARRTLEARLDMIRAYWRANGGRPFTTRAIRRFARHSDPELFEGEPYYSWTGALSYLASRGELVEIAKARRRYALWAPKGAWSALTHTERAERLHDPLRDTAGRPQLPTKSYLVAKKHDPFFVSRNNDMRVLFQTARRTLAFSTPDAGQARILAQRPLRSRDVDTLVDPDHPLRPDVGLSAAMWEATRMRKGMRRTELVHVGHAGHYEYYDLVRRAASALYVAFRRALYDAEPPRLGRDVAGFSTRVQDQVGTLAPVAAEVLRAQGVALLAEVGTLREELERRAAGVRLLDVERADVAEVLEDLVWLGGWTRVALDRVGPGTDELEGHANAVMQRGEPYPIERAWAEVQPFLKVRLRTPRMLPNVVSRVETLHVPPVHTGRPGHPIETNLDRIAWACYAASRWGGRIFAHLARTAANTIGPLRTPEPFTEALEQTSPEHHMGLVAALAMFADPESRAALVRYLWRGVQGDPHAVSYGAVELAAHGLAPLPFAARSYTLAPDEGAVLEAVRDHGPDQAVREAARRVLSVHGPDPDPEALRALYGMPSAPWHLWDTACGL